MTPIRSIPFFLVVAGALAACQPAPVAVPAAASVAAGGATIVVTPKIKEGGTRRLQANVDNYTATDVSHLVVKLFTLVVADETLVASDDVLAADLGDPLTFTNLKNDTTYRIRAYAYATADTSAPISLDASSYVDLDVIRDDAPVLGNLVVQLVDKTFSGEATSTGITINPGTLVTAGNESISH